MATVIVYKWANGALSGKCDKCGNVPMKGGKDVFFREPYWDSNLADLEHPHGQMVNSPRHKARIMREQGLIERGDRVHGARVPYERGYGGPEVDRHARI